MRQDTDVKIGEGIAGIVEYGNNVQELLDAARAWRTAIGPGGRALELIRARNRLEAAIALFDD